ncbi:MAG: N-acetyltransferase family protein [Myxococcota bacterium]
MSAPQAREVAADRGVRRARERDLGAVVDLWIAITRHHEAADPLFTLRPDARGEVERLVRAMWSDPDVALFVWEDRRGVAGLCIVRVDRAPPILEEDRRAEITDLMVETEHRRGGIGSALVRRAIAWVEEQGVRRVEVRVASRNPEGQAFWRAKGFGDLMDVLQKRL